jgi:DNA-binding protein H-NS
MSFADKFNQIKEAAQEKATQAVATVQAVNAELNEVAEIVAEQKGITAKEAKKEILKDTAKGAAQQAKSAITSAFRR